jgi:hypothetical protein
MVGSDVTYTGPAGFDLEKQVDFIKLAIAENVDDATVEAQIGLGRGGIAGGVIVNHDESESAEGDHRFKDFPRMSQGFVQGSLAHRNHFDQLLLGVEQDHPQRFLREKAHLAAELRYCQRRINQKLGALLAQGDGAKRRELTSCDALTVGRKVKRS